MQENWLTSREYRQVMNNSLKYYKMLDNFLTYHSLIHTEDHKVFYDNGSGWKFQGVCNKFWNESHRNHLEDCIAANNITSDDIDVFAKIFGYSDKKLCQKKSQIIYKVIVKLKEHKTKKLGESLDEVLQDYSKYYQSSARRSCILLSIVLFIEDKLA